MFYLNVIPSRNLCVFRYVIALNKSCLLAAHNLLLLSLSLPLDYEQLVRFSKLYILLASS